LSLALKDIDEVAEYIAKDDPDAAKRVVATIWQAGQSLRAMPGRGRSGRIPGTRELVLPDISYFIAYRIKEKCVQILRVIHTARNWRK